MMAWVDEHPSRYRAISDGDHVGMKIGEHRHFIQIHFPGLIPMARAACGHPMPADWAKHYKDFPIAGIVDCERCLEIAALIY